MGSTSYDVTIIFPVAASKQGTGGGRIGFELILPFFPAELRALLLDASISDLRINGTSGVYADHAGVIERTELSTPYTNDQPRTDRIQKA